MLKKFNTKELIFLAILGALAFVIDLVIVSGIDAATGIIGAGFLVSTVFFSMVVTAGVLIIKKFGMYTIGGFVYSVLAIPTLIIGPPGIYKIFIGTFLGLTADVTILLFRFKKIGYYFSLAVANILVLPVILYALIFLGLPGTELLADSLFFLVPVIGVESIIGSWIGIKLYEKKICKLTVVKQIRN